MRRYWSSACIGCSMKTQCTPSDYRRIGRWEHEAVTDAAEARLERAPQMMQIRRQTVEHPFATLKAWMGTTPLLTKTLPRVSTEMSLSVLAYNLRRMITLFGVRGLLEAIQTT
jgi:transposase